MSEPTVSFSPPPDSSSAPSAAAPPPSALSSVAVDSEFELLPPPPHPATTTATSPTRSTAIKATSRVLLDKPASDQEFAGLARTYTGFRVQPLSTGPNCLATLSE